jgi:hypothetical protein
MSNVEQEIARENAQEQRRLLKPFLDTFEAYTWDLDTASTEKLLTAAQRFVTRMTCESWGRANGWKIPPYDAPEWLDLYDAWLESEDE